MFSPNWPTIQDPSNPITCEYLSLVQPLAKASRLTTYAAGALASDCSDGSS